VYDGAVMACFFSDFQTQPWIAQTFASLLPPPPPLLPLHLGLDTLT
jgi:hypothetical protein